jgi:hypothetical protein
MGTDVLNGTRQGSQRDAPRLGLRVAGGALLAATAGIHLDLYLTGYRSVPTIGWLFLLQVVAAFGLALAVLVSGSQLAAAAGAGFALATLGGYLLSVWIGLFGFKEVRTTAGIAAGVIEIAAFAVLGVLAATPPASRPAGHPPARTALPGRLQSGIPGAGWVTAGLSIIALALLGIAVAGAGAPAPASAGGGLKAVRIGGVSVLANARGLAAPVRVAPGNGAAGPGGHHGEPQGGGAGDGPPGPGGPVQPPEDPHHTARSLAGSGG